MLSTYVCDLVDNLLGLANYAADHAGDHAGDKVIGERRHLALEDGAMDDPSSYERAR